MDDRTKLLKLHSDLQHFEIPKDFKDEEIQIVANTISEGFELMKSWLVDQAKKKFAKNTYNEDNEEHE